MNYFRAMISLVKFKKIASANRGTKLHSNIKWNRFCKGASKDVKDGLVVNRETR